MRKARHARENPLWEETYEARRDPSMRMTRLADSL